MGQRRVTGSTGGVSLLALGLALAPAGGAFARAGDDDPATDPPIDAATMADLAAEARLATIVRVIGQRNPDLREAQQRAQAAVAQAAAAAVRPDPELKGELWGVPLARPVSFGQANTIMLGLRQALPAWGSLDARQRAAREDAAAMGETAEARRQEAIAQAGRAFAAYARADREFLVHLEHVGVMSRMVELARSLYQVGHGAQQDVLQAQTEFSRLHADVAAIEQQRQSARAQLNALMDRAPDAALGPAPDVVWADVLAEKDVVVDALDRADDQVTWRRPEVRAARRAVGRSVAALEATRREAERPMLTVGADYWYMPTAPSHHGYGAMLSMSLPWLNPRRRDQVTAAEHTAAAERSALRAQEAAARFQLRDAQARRRAAAQTLLVLHERVLPDARRSFDSAQALYQSGQGPLTAVLEAARVLLQVRIDQVRAVADLDVSRVEHTRATGEELRP